MTAPNSPTPDTRDGAWTDAQCIEFLSVAMRHVEIKGELHVDEIRQGVAAADRLAAIGDKP